MVECDGDYRGGRALSHSDLSNVASRAALGQGASLPSLKVATESRGPAVCHRS